jgi:hypothetical protein
VLRLAGEARTTGKEEVKWRTVGTAELLWLPDQGASMADKSPRQQKSQKAGKSLKEKRADKHAKADAKNKIQIIPPTGKR